MPRIRTTGRTPARASASSCRPALLPCAVTGWPAAYGPARPGRELSPALAALWATLASGAEVPGRALGASGPGGSPGPASGAAPDPEGPDVEELRGLLVSAQRGDADAYGRIYELHVDRVYRFIVSRVGDRTLAEDLTSETFLRGLRRIDSFSWQGRDMVAWFITIARNIVLDHAKAARTRFETPTGEMFDADEVHDSPESEVVTRDRDARLLAALGRLRPEQAECLSLRFLHERSLAETAEILGRTEGAVKQLQLRAIRALREVLGDDLERAAW